MILNDETLMAYADGEAENAAEIEAALATRPHLAARVAEMRALRKTVAAAFAPVTVEPAPARLAALVSPPRKVHMAGPSVIKSAPLYPFIALAAASVALFVSIVAAPEVIPGLQPRAVVSANDSETFVPPVAAPKRTPLAAHSASPLELAPAPSPLPARVYADAVWVQQPDPRTIERYYPARAAAQNISGRAVLDCRVNADGSVGCVVGSEDPGDWGFGAAAMEVAKHFLAAEKAANGMSTADGRLTIPVTFAPRNCGAAPSAIALGAAAMRIANPIWVSKPEARDLTRFYPRRALERGKRGQAVVSCVIALDGSLANCVTARETPTGWGFGDAAIQMAQHFRAAPQSASGESTAGRVVDLPITFKQGP